MDANKLNTLLDKAINDYVDETAGRYNNSDRDCPATKQDLFELSQQITYVLDKFKDSIIKCCK